MFQQEVVEGTMAGAAAGGADQLDLEAAKQLIQLSGGDDVVSESGSADSVKCRGADQAAGMKEKDEDEAAVESRRRRNAERFPAQKVGDGGEQAAGGPDRRSADSVNKSSRVAGAEEKDNKEEPTAVESRRKSAARFLAGKDGAGVVDVDGGEERKRPRFRWLADIYRETRQVTTRDPRTVGGNVPPEADERRRKRKRAADDADKEVAVPMVSKASKERTMVA